MESEKQNMAQPPAARKLVGEWFWRFLAVAMLFAVGWVVWISYQLNPPPLATSAAFEAAAKASATRDVQGVIAPAAPPVNVEKLRLTDSIATPLPEQPKR